MDLNIKTSDLEDLMKLLVDKLKTMGIEQVSFDYDNYMIITANEWKNFETSPEPFVGSLADDCQMLLKSLKDPSRFSYVDFDRLASIIHAISQELNPI